MPANPTPAEGVVVVPVEPTEAMKEAYFETVKRLGFNGCINASTAWEAMLAARPAAPTQSAAQTGEVLKARVDTLVNILAPDQGESLSEERRRLFAIASAIQSDLRALSQPEAGR